MSKKSSRRHKTGKLPRGEESDTRSDPTSAKAGKATTFWTVPTILGLVLAAASLITGLVFLRPQMTVSPQEPLERSQPFSVPFRITNAGYLALHITMVNCYFEHVEVGQLTEDQSDEHSPSWDDRTLERQEPETVICYLVHAPTPPKKADIAIVVDYHPYGIPFFTFRRYFRFVGEYIDNWQWLGQPSGPIQSNADAQIKKSAHFRRHPQR
jgi:hypothetical protein